MKRGAYVGDDGDEEWLCKHGVGHGYGVHTCDGEKCCKEALSHLKAPLCKCDAFAMPHPHNPCCQLFEITHGALRKRDKEGIKSQKHILKELDKKRGLK